MVIFKLKWKKFGSGKDLAKCWYCQTSTDHILVGKESDYFEVWCCQKCKRKKGRIRKHRAAQRVKAQTSKIFGITRGKMTENATENT